MDIKLVGIVLRIATPTCLLAGFATCANAGAVSRALPAIRPATQIGGLVRPVGSSGLVRPSAQIGSNGLIRPNMQTGTNVFVHSGSQIGTNAFGGSSGQTFLPMPRGM